MNVVAIDKADVYTALRATIDEKPKSAYDVLQRVSTDLQVSRDLVVAALWELVEDEGLVYDAAARIHKPAS